MMRTNRKRARQNNPDAILGFLKERASPARRYIRASVMLSCLGGILMITAAWILATVIDKVIFSAAGREDVFPFLLSIAAIYTLRGALNYGADRMAFLGASIVKNEVRNDLFRGLIHAGPAGVKSERSGGLINSYIHGVEALQGYYMQTLPSRMTAVIIPLAVFLLILPIDVISGLVLFVTAPLIPVFMIWIGRGAESLSQRQWQRMNYMGGRFLDAIQGLTTLKLFNASRREADTIRLLGEGFRHDTMAVLKIAFLSSLAMEFFATVSIALIAVLIGFRLLWGEMTFVQGFFILLLAPEFYLPLRKMGAHYHAKMEAIGAAEKIVALIPVASESSGHKDFNDRDVNLEFRDVSFAYEKDVPVLKDVSFVIQAGEKVALSGSSGSGKSTILALILGLIIPDSGQILVNGENLQNMNSEAWRRGLSWMGQSPRLFSGSVADNIHFADPSAVQADIEKLIFRCGLEEFANNKVSENGVGLSGGQIQRVAMARALLRNSPLLLLDEPTAHLDSKTEGLIQKLISDMGAGATIVFSAHRATTLAAADRVFSLENGYVHEREKRRVA